MTIYRNLFRYIPTKSLAVFLWRRKGVKRNLLVNAWCIYFSINMLKNDSLFKNNNYDRSLSLMLWCHTIMITKILILGFLVTICRNPRVPLCALGGCFWTQWSQNDRLREGKYQGVDFPSSRAEMYSAMLVNLGGKFAKSIYQNRGKPRWRSE